MPADRSSRVKFPEWSRENEVNRNARCSEHTHIQRELGTNLDTDSKPAKIVHPTYGETAASESMYTQVRHLSRNLPEPSPVYPEIVFLDLVSERFAVNSEDSGCFLAHPFGLAEHDLYVPFFQLLEGVVCVGKYL